MALYQNLVSAYDEIFPFSGETAAFLGPPPKRGDSAIDIGCATGSCSLALARMGWQVLGIDPEPAMIDRAREKARSAEGGGNCRFATGTMQRLRSFAAPGVASLAVCLGNTVPHLDSVEPLRAFCRDVAAELEPGGRFVVQLLNYELIKKRRPAALPTIETSSLSFAREYRYEKDGSIAFATTLRAASGEERRDETRLWPFEFWWVEGAMERAGFEDIVCFADWRREPFLPEESFQVILEGRKPA